MIIFSKRLDGVIIFVRCENNGIEKILLNHIKLLAIFQGRLYAKSPDWFTQSERAGFFPALRTLCTFVILSFDIIDRWFSMPRRRRTKQAERQQDATGSALIYNIAGKNRWNFSSGLLACTRNSPLPTLDIYLYIFGASKKKKLSGRCTNIQEE